MTLHIPYQSCRHRRDLGACAWRPHRNHDRLGLCGCGLDHAPGHRDWPCGCGTARGEDVVVGGGYNQDFRVRRSAKKDAIKDGGTLCSVDLLRRLTECTRRDEQSFCPNLLARERRVRHLARPPRPSKGRYQNFVRLVYDMTLSPSLFDVGIRIAQASEMMPAVLLMVSVLAPGHGFIDEQERSPGKYVLTALETRVFTCACAFFCDEGTGGNGRHEGFAGRKQHCACFWAASERSGIIIMI